jgi:hypothetical protein
MESYISKQTVGISVRLIEKILVLPIRDFRSGFQIAGSVNEKSWSLTFSSPALPARYYIHQNIRGFRDKGLICS